MSRQGSQQSELCRGQPDLETAWWELATLLCAIMDEIFHWCKRGAALTTPPVHSEFSSHVQADGGPQRIHFLISLSQWLTRSLSFVSDTVLQE